MSLNDSSKSINENSILYELLVYGEWFTEHDTNSRKYQQSSVSLWSTLSSLNPSRFLYSSQIGFDVKSVPDLPWRLACTQDGMVVAILQDTFLEIRIAKDGYVAVVGKANVGHDEHASLRRICWSPDSSTIALARSSGAVSLYSLLGSHLSTIPAKPSSTATRLNPIITLTFLNTKFKHTKWCSELLLVQFDGTVRSYMISALNSNTTEENIRCHLGAHYPRGISSAVYHPQHHILLVTGYQTSSKKMVSSWRILSDVPYLKPAFGDEDKGGGGGGWLRWLPFSSKDEGPVFIRMKISPDGSTLAVVEKTGTISLFAAPSLKILRKWQLAEQPDCGASESDMSGLFPVDVEWWSDDALVVVRRNGAVTVCSTETLENLLGEAAEMLCGPPQVVAVRGGRQGVLILDCEKHRSSENELQSEEETELDDATLLQQSIQAALYSVTDIETFQPKKRPTRLVQRTYRLLGIKSITPEELYLRKIENCAYEDALVLAQTYGLDCDLVYQRQWRTNPVSSESIHSYLRKVKDVEWVANECLQRVPDSLEAANELLRFGLDVTECKGDKRPEEKRKMVAIRLQILYYLDGLILYDKILGTADEYDRMEYDTLRRISSLEAAVRFARAERRDAVTVLLSYRHEVLGSHYLPIVSNLPETLRPTLYKSLLPQLTADGNSVVAWESLTLRKKDWAEAEEFKNLSARPVNDASILYEDEPSLTQFNVDTLTPELVALWYRTRACQIEQQSGLVEHAALLVRIAREKHIPNLDCLYFDLLTLEALVSVGDDSTSLSTVETLPHLQQATLLLQNTTPSTFIADLKAQLLAFAARCQERQCHDKVGLIKGLMLQYAETGLKLPLVFLEHLKQHSKCPLGLSLADVMEVALDCVYTYPDADQLDNAMDILECLPEKVSDKIYSAEEEKLHVRIDQLEKHLAVCGILEKSNCGRSVKFVKSIVSDLEQAKLLMEMVAASDNLCAADSSELLDDLLELQEVFTLVDTQYCYELFASNRLNSESAACISAAEDFLACWSKETWKPVPYERSVAIILRAANNYLEKATAFDDPCVKLAEQCLKLVNESEAEVQECLNLIEALLLLGDFNVRVLPLQVRMMSNRWPLIEKCLASKPEAYKSCELLIQLAQSLHLEGSDRQKREGEVLLMVANTAFNAGDYKYSSEVCGRLMSRSYMPAWDIMQRLGTIPSVDSKKQQEFLAFSILYCPRNTLEDVVELRINARAEQHKFMKLCAEC